MTPQRVVLALAVCAACAPATPDSALADSMGIMAADVRRIPTRLPGDLEENSAAAMSRSHPGVFFTINDSGNEPVLFALDTAGRARGAWRVAGPDVTNEDWEAAAIGPCAATAAASARVAGWCVYIGDTGDNGAVRREPAIYRMEEPAPDSATLHALGTLSAARLRYRYVDAPHDVEAMVVAPNGDVVLVTKRPLHAAGGSLRPALVFRLPARAWESDSLAVAQIADSLPIVPGSAIMRTITDASLSPNGRRLAVRTYGQVYVFATDSATTQVDHAVAPAVCDIAPLSEAVGEGITWMPDGEHLLLTSEGRKEPIYIVRCPLAGSDFVKP